VEKHYFVLNDGLLYAVNALKLFEKKKEKLSDGEQTISLLCIMNSVISLLATKAH
jgi:hypothetical protein